MTELAYRPAREVWVHAIEHLASPPKGVQLPWWPSMNRFTGGLRAHELTLLCAPTGAGKTQLLANLSAQFLIGGVPHFVAPVETGDVDYMARMMSVLDRRDYNTGDAVPVETLSSVNERHSQLLARAPMLISTHDNRVSTEDMLNLLKYMHSSYGAKVALLDNLNFFLRVVSSNEEKAEMDKAIHQFVILAKKLPIHVILIVHPRKTEKGRVESEFDIKGSSTAVQEASNVLLFNRPLPDDGRRQPTDRELVFRKIRKRGAFVGRPIWFLYNNGRFEEYHE